MSRMFMRKWALCDPASIGREKSPAQWQLCFESAPGLTPAGRCEASCGESDWSNSLQIGVDVSDRERQTTQPCRSEALSIGDATDGKTWNPILCGWPGQLDFIVAGGLPTSRGWKMCEYE